MNRVDNTFYANKLSSLRQKIQNIQSKKVNEQARIRSRSGSASRSRSAERGRPGLAQAILDSP